MKNRLIMFWAIIAIVIVSIVLIITKPNKLGLDLVGGSRLVLEAQKTATVAKITPDMMDSLQFAIENRVNKLGVAETIVQREGENRLVVEIPNVKDLATAKAFIGDTAELDFKRPVTLNGVQSWTSTGLTGKDLSKANLSTNSSSGQWVVDLEFNGNGTRKFANLTRELVGQPMAIFFNGEMQSAPVIKEPILQGSA